MAKLPNLDHIKYVRAKGRVYAYFNTGRKVNGKVVYARLPDPAAPDFFTRYQALKAGRTKRATAPYTVAGLIDDYLASAELRGKSDATKRSYAIHLAKARKPWGHFSAEALQSSHVRFVLERETWSAATRNMVLATLSAVFKWGRQNDRTAADPVKGIVRAKMGEYDPWPEHVLEAALASDNDRVRLAVHLLYFTGQRIGDVCKMRWSDVKGGWVSWTQTKTGKHVSFPVAADLQAELDRTPRKGLTILCGNRGPLSDQTIRAALQDFTASMGVKTVPHGLRKNAVIALLEAGCTVPEVGAITGQSHKVVEYYARQVSGKRLGSAAILKMDSRRNK